MISARLMVTLHLTLMGGMRRVVRRNHSPPGIGTTPTICSTRRWDPPGPDVQRWFRGGSWFVETGPDCGYCVQVDGAQRLDGTVNERQVVLDNTELKVDQARQLATALTATRWTKDT
jgi:hypothetical protein